VLDWWVEGLITVFERQAGDPFVKMFLICVDFLLQVVVQLFKLSFGEESGIDDGSIGFDAYVSGAIT
jgi:hypothetical protein